ncbi:MAG: DUF2277 domain-containing protein [Pseudomonadota bacterium]
MCRSIKTLHNYEPPASREEIEAAALQFVRKVSGYRKPSVANKKAFDMAVASVADTVESLLGALVTRSEPKLREPRGASPSAPLVR